MLCIWCGEVIDPELHATLRQGGEVLHVACANERDAWTREMLDEYRDTVEDAAFPARIAPQSERGAAKRKTA